ncbi:hypothetical protein LXM56_15835 [Lysinibacillus fusiformis]|uniref:hypothetical protein n=1 Tax=Lysinibacillus fusiformis TaxID=28031 RepID=UPI001E5474D4|nr:hypothetical protein [Lysinibacillus fusiformis]MCE4045585.1 hypothetical protein [Lysinibacillus fusiformis]
MTQFIDWLGNLSTGVLGSIIATIICSLFLAGVAAIRVKRKSKLYISHSDIGGDVVVGDKIRKHRSEHTSVRDNRKTNTSIKKTKVRGDVVQGDKEE